MGLAHLEDESSRGGRDGDVNASVVEEANSSSLGTGRALTATSNSSCEPTTTLCPSTENKNGDDEDEHRCGSDDDRGNIHASASGLNLVFFSLRLFPLVLNVSHIERLYVSSYKGEKYSNQVVFTEANANLLRVPSQSPQQIQDLDYEQGESLTLLKSNQLL